MASIDISFVPPPTDLNGPRRITVTTSSGGNPLYENVEPLRGPPNGKSYGKDEAAQMFLDMIQGPESEARKGLGGRSQFYYVKYVFVLPLRD